MKNFIALSIAAMLLILSPVVASTALAQEPEQKAQQADDKAQSPEQEARDEEEEEEVEADPVKEAVNQALSKFYMALNAMLAGNVEPMKAVWSHAEDVTYMPPDGKYLVGWEETLKSWEQQAALKLGGTVIPKEINYNIGETIAVVQNYEEGSNVIDGEKQTVKIRATNVFRLEDGQWKMIGHHTDILPFLVKDEMQ